MWSVTSQMFVESLNRIFFKLMLINEFINSLSYFEKLTTDIQILTGSDILIQILFSGILY